MRWEREFCNQTRSAIKFKSKKTKVSYKKWREERTKSAVGEGFLHYSNFHSKVIQWFCRKITPQISFWFLLQIYRLSIVWPAPRQTTINNQFGSKITCGTEALSKGCSGNQDEFGRPARGSRVLRHDPRRLLLFFIYSLSLFGQQFAARAPGQILQSQEAPFKPCGPNEIERRRIKKIETLQTWLMQLQTSDRACLCRSGARSGRMSRGDDQLGNLGGGGDDDWFALAFDVFLPLYLSPGMRSYKCSFAHFYYCYSMSRRTTALRAVKPAGQENLVHAKWGRERDSGRILWLSRCLSPTLVKPRWTLLA